MTVNTYVLLDVLSYVYVNFANIQNSCKVQWWFAPTVINCSS